MSGDGSFSPTVGFTPTEAGKYWWYASYGGDMNNNPNVSACGASMAETTVKQAVPSGTTITSVRVSARKRRATFTFTAIAGTGFQCALILVPKRGRLPSPSFASCGSPKTYAHLRAASYIFEVRGVNTAAVDPNPATKRIRA